MAEKKNKKRTKAGRGPEKRPAGKRAPSTQALQSGPTAHAGQLIRGGAITLWRQIADDFEAQILANALLPDTRLPTEAELADRYDVNRHTIRRALGELARKGLVVAFPRRGTFVAKLRIPYRIDAETGFSANMTVAGREPAMRLVQVQTGQAPKEMAEWMKIAAAARVVEIEHLRMANSVPICLVTSWFPANRFARIAKVYAHTASLTKAFARLGVRSVRRKLTRITCRLAKAQERDVLELPDGAVVVVVEALHTDAAGEPIASSIASFSAARVEFILET